MFITSRMMELKLGRTIEWDNLHILCFILHGDTIITCLIGSAYILLCIGIANGILTIFSRN